MTLEQFTRFKQYCVAHFINITGQYDVIEDEVIFYNNNLLDVATSWLETH